MESCRLAGSWCGGAPLAFYQHPMLLVVFNFALAVFAHIHGFFRFVLRPADLREFQNLIFVAMGARYPVVTLIAIFKTCFNSAAAGDFGGRDHEYLAPSEC